MVTPSKDQKSLDKLEEENAAANRAAAETSKNAAPGDSPVDAHGFPLPSEKDMARRNQLLQQINQPANGAMSPLMLIDELEKLNGGEAVPFVRMRFPRNVTLQLDNGGKVYFARGDHDVPESVAGHRYLRSCGAERV